MKRFVVAASMLALAGCQSAGGRAELNRAADLDTSAKATDSESAAPDQITQGIPYYNGDGAVVPQATDGSEQVVLEPGSELAFSSGSTAAAAFGKDAEPEPKPVAYAANLAGSWHVDLSSEGRVCQLELGSKPKRAGFNAKASECMDRDLFFVSNWGVRDEELLLFDDLSRIKSSMRMTGQDRWEGQLASHSKPITITRRAAE
ncbi:hypothetical protein GCM10007094_22120 [Pseudovibrio japonicus]|uniref:Alkaline proteinase inhibitor/ Outer membrane lipoprotein Omp19 domain-containing protein n=1 Tax=Pseudovibrio japonicus TaxID=366534 RepID=A0ABQ3EFV9_9HYPH|nr:AprI/Inh family metalloprotease inhibitor [Pseudovibrio japonicus]GHB32764.1 hypothetical protein GCM10007094_22120 [Pseudovibrio japonicus]